MITDLLHGWEELNEAYPGYVEARRQFDGDEPEVFANDRIRRMLEITGDKYKFHLIRKPVTTLASRVKLQSVTASNASANKALQDVWLANDMDVWNPHIIKNALMYGDMYVSVWQVDPAIVLAEDGTPDATADGQTVQSGIEVVVHDPEHTRIVYDEATMRRKLFAITRWKVEIGEGQSVWRVNLVYPHAIERWISKNENPSDAASWVMYFEPDEEPNPDTWLQEVEVPGELNFFHYRTQLPYGEPEHYCGYGCQNAITKHLVTENCVTDRYGWPERYALTEAGAELDTAGDSPDWDDDADAGVVDQTPTGFRRSGQSSALRGGPGSLQRFSGIKTVGEWATAQPDIFTEPTMFYIRLMSVLTDTPLYAFDPTGDMPSGESLKTADAPLNDKAKSRLLMFTGPVREQWKYTAALLGKGQVDISVQWGPTEIAVGLDDWNVIQAKQTAGVPQDVTLTEAGYDSDSVARWMSSDADVMDLSRRITMLSEIGDALTKLGTAAGLGVVDQVEVQAIVSRILPQASPDADPQPS